MKFLSQNYLDAANNEEIVPQIVENCNLPLNKNITEISFRGGADYFQKIAITFDDGSVANFPEDEWGSSRNI